MEETAEKILHHLQQRLLQQAEANPLAAFAPLDDTAAAASVTPGSSRRTLRGLEEAWGASATKQGRWLEELLHGSAAWEIMERPLPGRRRRDAPPLPRFREISRCEPLLRIMRESGELAEREQLLKERDNTLRVIGSDAALSEAERQQAIRESYDRYFADIARLAAAYRPFYQNMRRALDTIPSLTGPRVRSLPLLQPPLMTRLFAACHAEKAVFFLPPSRDAEQSAAVSVATYRSGSQAVTIQGVPEALKLLDEMAWDMAAIAVCAFFVRTTGRDPDAPFPLLVDDYFDWRGVDPRKRTREARQQIEARLQLLASPEQLSFATEGALWLASPDKETAHRRRPRRSLTTVTAQGAFLRRRSGLFRPSPWLSEAENEPLYGHLISLGEWARPFVQEGAMIGIFPRKIAEYDLRRQQWERRMGWYLTFQMQNQGAKMTFREADGPATAAANDKPAVQVIPQHSLKMKTVLENSYVPWEEMARTNPGKVIRQWVETLETLRRDAVLGEYSCLDGAVDGSDLPMRSRLSVMLNHRYLFTPGGDLAERLLRRKAARRKPD